MTVTRQRLLDGAAGILDGGLYDRLTIDALASTLRMSKSTLYKHFDSKDALVDALVEYICEATEGELQGISAEAEPARAFASLFEVFARHADRVPKAFVLQPEKLPRACRLRMDDTRRLLALAFFDVIGRGVAQHAFRAVDPRAAGHAVLAGLEATNHAAARGEIGGPRSDAIRSLQPVYATGLRAA